MVPGVVLGGLSGLGFALLAGRRASGPGAGLLWGLAFFVLLWLAGPATLVPMFRHAAAFCSCETARAHFAELVAYLLCFGLPLGLALGLLGARSPGAAPRPFSLPRALVGGGVAGGVGGWAFGRGGGAGNFYPLGARRGRSESPPPRAGLHLP